MSDYNGTITCHRCGKPIVRANKDNADYIMADDVKETEAREQIVAVVEEDGKEVRKDVANAKAAKGMPGLKRVEMEEREVEIPKTAIVCPDCYQPTDTVIWGVHKEKAISEA